METIVAATLILQLFLPLSLIVWVAAGIQRPRVLVLLDVVLVLGFVWAISIAGLWIVLPPSLVPILAAITLLAGLAAWLGRGQRSSPGRLQWIGRLSLVALIGIVLAQGLNGHLIPEGPAVALEYPLGPGSYLVANGGSSELINAHVSSLENPRFEHYRGQSYAIDLVGVGSWGSRNVPQLLPEDLGAYAIYDATVIAPCSGQVIRSVDGLPDMPPGVRDTANLEGNHVLIDCGGVWVLVGHLRQGSVLAAEGISVRTGATLGRVGNSGQSDEPHLHLHAQTPTDSPALLSGDPIPVLINGNWLVRNERLDLE